MAPNHAPSEAPAWEGLAVKSNSRRAPVIVAVVALGALAAMVLGIWLAYSSWKHQPWTHQLMWTELRPGDCLTGSDLGLGTGGQWPYTVSAVPCTQRHLAEVIFAGNLWPASLTAFPGESAVTNTVDNRCQSELFAYAGEAEAALNYDSIAPVGGSDWGSGDRRVVCLAYEPGFPLFHSLRVKHH
jgi:hypothetical protein